MYCEHAQVELIGCTIRDNYAMGGGGIFAHEAFLLLANCTVSGNWAEEYGGGIYAESGLLGMANCTVSDNEAENHDGGGVFAVEACLEMLFCTVTDNHAGEDGGGVYYFPEGPCGGVANTILAGNTCGNDGPDFHGVMFSFGHNLIGDPDFDYYEEVESPGTDIFGEDPMLAPLQDNGGPTETHALRLGSPAIDAGWCEDWGGLFDELTDDQRGVERPQGETCDIGAYEYRRSGSANPPPSGASGCGVNHPPVPNAGEDQVVCVGERVFLDGSRSHDPDEGIPPNVITGATAPQYVHQRREDLEFQWAIAVLYYAAGRPVLAIPEGANVHTTMQDFNTEIGSFIPNVAGVYQFDLFVTDDFGDTLSDRVTITVIECPSFELPAVPEDEFQFERLVVYPNPFNDEVHFGSVGDGAADTITVTVLDLAGNVIWEGRAEDAPELIWDGRSSDGQLLASGPYIYRIILVAEDLMHTETGTLLLKR
ncbi:choice-of-anchor Q domain-containing protein [Candidatus Bipolaricaulota bacterium]